MNNFLGFSLSLIKRFAIQILISLYYMREHNIVHCDLKPENILLRKINKSGIKIIDFGSGCFENEKIYTYIQSRFYRAPEIVLGIPYNSAIDMWSFGCILYELYVGHPLFPGEDEKDHMALMMEVKGVPPRSVLARATRRKVFFDDDYRPIIVPNSKGKLRVPNSKNLPDLMNSSDPDFVDFIDVSVFPFRLIYLFLSKFLSNCIYPNSIIHKHPNLNQTCQSSKLWKMAGSHYLISYPFLNQVDWLSQIILHFWQTKFD